MYLVPEPSQTQTNFLTLPLELRTLIYKSLIASYTLTISSKTRKIHLLENTTSPSTSAQTPAFQSLPLVSHRVLADYRYILPYTLPLVPMHIPDIHALTDFEKNMPAYRPQWLQALAFSSSQHIIVKSPCAWIGLHIPAASFLSMKRFEVTGIHPHGLDIDILRLTLAWPGWRRDGEKGDEKSWVFVPVA